jgi:myo-inositol-1(or 4)-monophosphatase
MINLEDLTKEVCKIAKEAGEFIRGEISRISTSDVESKSLHNYVTHVDKEAEKMITASLGELIPQAGFIVEEATISKKGERFTWIVDPLDGTTNFIHGLPCFSVSIALMDHKEIVSGVIYEINLDECFYAWKSGGSYLNGQKISVTSAPKLENSLLATGFPYFDYSLLDKYMQLFTWCLRNTHGVRRLGSAAVDLAYTACGRFDGFFEYSLSPWDVAAGAILVKEAGGTVTDFNGANDYIFGKQMLATNSYIHKELIDKVQEVFGK